MTEITDKATFWQRHINDWRSSGLSQKSYCQSHQLSYPNFGYWLKRFRAHASVGDLQLLPVQISPSTVTQSNICLHLAMCRVELPVYTDTSYVRALVKALS